MTHQSWRAREEEAQEYLEKQGYDLVFRSDRSRGIFDLIAIRSFPPHKPILCLQMKTSDSGIIRISPEEKNNLIEFASRAPQFMRCQALLVWNWTTNKIWDIRDVANLKNENRPDSYWSGRQWYRGKY